MFRFLLGLIYVLYILIKSSKSSSVVASFNEPCSINISCTYPLICSNTSRCICSKSSSIWNSVENDCFYCPSGWIEWENNHCLSLSVPPEGGLSYNQANDTCHSLSAELFYIYNIQQFKQFEYQVNELLQSTYSNAVSLFFHLGAWIDKLNLNGIEDVWCNEIDVHSSFDCVYITKKNLKNSSLCLSRLKCNENIPFICDMPATSEKYSDDYSTSSDQRFIQLLTALAPMALDLLGNLFNKQPAQQPTPQQIIIQQEPAALVPQSDDTILYVGLIIGGFILLLVICCGAGALIYFTGCLKPPGFTGDYNQRSSIESSSSYT